MTKLLVILRQNEAQAAAAAGTLITGMTSDMDSNY